MGIIKKAKDILLGPAFSEDDTFIGDDLDDPTEEIDTPVLKPQKPVKPIKVIPTGPKVVSIHPAVKMEIIRTSPMDIVDAFTIIDYLSENKICVVNVSKTDAKKSARITDFISGAVYVLNGKMQDISNNIYIVVPSSVEITGQLKEELKEEEHTFSFSRYMM